MLGSLGLHWGSHRVVCISVGNVEGTVVAVGTGSSCNSHTVAYNVAPGSLVTVQRVGLLVVVGVVEWVAAGSVCWSLAEQIWRQGLWSMLGRS